MVPQQRGKINFFSSMLHSSASFSIYADDQNQEQVVGLEAFEKGITIEVSKEALGSGSDFSFSKGAMGLIQEEEMEDEYGLHSVKKWGFDDGEIDLRPASPPLYLAAGLGMDASGLGGGYDPVDFYDEKIVDEPPSLLRNYVQSLWVSSSTRPNFHCDLLLNLHELDKFYQSMMGLMHQISGCSWVARDVSGLLLNSLFFQNLS